MQPLTTGIYTCSKLRAKGFLPNDKMAMVHRLGQRGGYCYPARPRRFRKSLPVSTMRTIVGAKLELHEPYRQDGRQVLLAAATFNPKMCDLDRQPSGPAFPDDETQSESYNETQ